MKRKKTLFVCLIVLSICMGLFACNGQQNIHSQSTDLGNSSEISTPDSEVDDDGELDYSSTEGTSSFEEDDDNDSSSSDDSSSNDSSSDDSSSNDSSNDDSSSSDEWIDIVFPRM